MKRLLISICIFVGLSTIALAQSKSSSQPQNFYITRDGLPPVLDIESGSVQFSDKDKNNVINAGEECAISMIIKNSGEGDASGCVAHIRATGTIRGLKFNDIILPVISHGEKHQVIIPIISSNETTTGEVEFSIVIQEPHGFGTEPITISVPTQAFLAPCLEVVSQKVITANNTSLTKKMPFTLRVVVQNTNQGTAEQVRIDFREPKNVLLTSGNAHTNIPALKPNETVTLDYELISTVNAADNIPFQIALAEKYGKYAHDKTIDLHFGQPTGVQTNYVIHGNLHKEVDIKRVSLVSDVDKNIPKTNNENINTYVLIIANENYSYMDKVAHAANDGKIFQEYCINTLGIPAQKVFYYENATIGNMADGISRISYALNNFENSKAIVYYCGHGIPDEKTGQAYLIPVDGKGTNMKTCYSLQDLYKTLAATKAQSITYFMDACFTGANKEGSMLVAARGVAREPVKETLAGKTVVFSASSGDETAMTLEEQGHGLFTYYLLKKLQETEGNVTYGELADYINKNVKKDAFLINEKPQTPVVATSPAVQNTWKTMKLK
ncbi:MAG: caspase family protein [Paludibacteraceae bacterium]|nr:caspase family protein [Paludibacteraceae bacterium]